ncbi:MAG: hypothetical protein PWP39_540 [Pyrococcus sp.]|uniref:hypothetical protein n=1 Tax=Pyrococcus sp. TaxID=33866 RepID=UPI0025899D31|nr:hypothetical protein [Pyrococcus sp.]MDK2869305.1 hypothetical protein [Pyrococcus sp.]
MAKIEPFEKYTERYKEWLERNKRIQTLFKKLDEIHDIEPVEGGYGRGDFVVIRAKKVV